MATEIKDTTTFMGLFVALSNGEQFIRVGPGDWIPLGQNEEDLSQKNLDELYSKYLQEKVVKLRL